MERNQKINGCDHIQLGGMAYYDEKKYFMFTPNEPVAGQMASFRRRGIAQQMSDGTFDFVAKPKLPVGSILIMKTAHGRASLTKDGGVQLTLKVSCNENVNISETIRKEALVCSEGIRNFMNRPTE